MINYLHILFVYFVDILVINISKRNNLVLTSVSFTLCKYVFNYF